MADRITEIILRSGHSGVVIEVRVENVPGAGVEYRESVYGDVEELLEFVGDEVRGWVPKKAPPDA